MAASKRTSDDATKTRKRVASKKHYAANNQKVLMQQKTHRAANADELAAKRKKYEAANAAKLVAQRKARYDKNRAQLLVKQMEYKQAHKEALKAKSKSWHFSNRAYRAAYDRARRARKKVIAAGEIPPPPLKLAAFCAQREASDNIDPAATTTGAVVLEPEFSVEHGQNESAPRALAAATKPVVMVTFTDEHPFNMRKRGPEPCCDECALFQPNALTSATNTVLLPGTYMCTFCRDWTYYRLHRKHKRTRADARLDALTA